MLKNSARNSSVVFSEVWKNLNAEKSHVLYPGPTMVLRPTLPKDPRGGSTNAQVLNHAVGVRILLGATQVGLPGTVPAVFGSPTWSGRCDTPPAPPSALAKLPFASSTVNQFPLESDTMVAICQPPTTWFANPVAFPRKCWP